MWNVISANMAVFVRASGWVSGSAFLLIPVLPLSTPAGSLCNVFHRDGG